MVFGGDGEIEDGEIDVDETRLIAISCVHATLQVNVLVSPSVFPIFKLLKNVKKSKVLRTER